LIALTVDTDVAADEDLFGKVISDLQSNVTVGDGGIDGTLNYIDDYSSAFGADEKTGHFICLHAEVPDVEGVTITAEVVGGDHGPATLDADGILIARIKNTTQKIKFTATKTGSEPVSKEYRLNGLILA